MPSTSFLSGDPASWMCAALDTNPNDCYDLGAGRYVVRGFLGSSTVDKAATMLNHVGGTRYAFLPFFFDVAGARVRAENARPIFDRRRISDKTPVEQPG